MQKEYQDLLVQLVVLGVIGWLIMIPPMPEKIKQLIIGVLVIIGVILTLCGLKLYCF